MAIQYYMRAYNTNIGQFVDWIVNDAPDTSGNFSGYPTGDLSNIIVNRVISSKIDNFLKPSNSLGGADGNYFHLNSYDWLKTAAPISAPTSPIGIAVERGITSINTVADATDSTPINILTNTNHGLTTGAYVTIIGVEGNAAANGTFPITVTGVGSFNLDGSSGSGAYTGGGDVYRPTNSSTMTWDEVTSQWRFVINTNGDGVTLGTSQNVRLLNNFVDGYASLGTTAHGTTTQAQSGVIRIPNNQFMVGRNVGSSADYSLIGVDTLNRIKIGSGATDLTYMPGNLIVDGYIVHDGTGTNVATTGFIREQNNTTIIAFRNAAQDANILALSSNSSNQITLGDAVNGGIFHNTATNATHAFQVNSTSFLELGRAQSGANTPFDNSAFIRFSQAAPAPAIGQVALTSGSGATMTVQAQATSANSQTGGILRLASGRGSGSGGFDGTIDFYTGTPTGGGTVKMTIHPTTAPVSANNNSIQFFENRLRFDVAQTSPRLLQDDVTTTSTNGQALTVQAQNATGATSTGGNLALTSGTGTTSAGNVIIQTGGSPQIIVTPTQTTILGNLLINGTTTSIASTVVELADRVIHMNSSANQFPGTTVAAPTQITGFSIDRGSTNNTTKRDYYGLFWYEPDQYWKFAVNTDGYTTETALSTTLPLIAQYHMVQPNASVTAAAIPTAGGYRSLNNTTHSASRNAAGTQDLLLLGTDSSNRIVHGSGTNNAGHIFNTTTGTTYDFQVNSVSTYTVTPVSAGTTTLTAASTVTALTYSHATTGSATGAVTTIQAQNAATTGGNLVLTSGTGATAGNVDIQTGATSRLLVAPTTATFTLPTVQFATAVVSPVIKQIDDATGSITGDALTVQAQNATGTTSTGGNLVLTSGTGTTSAGNVDIQIGGSSKFLTTPSQYTLNNATMQWALGVASPIINQANQTTNSVNGQSLTIQAQNSTGTSTNGGSLILSVGTGTNVSGNGTLQFNAGGASAVRWAILPTGNSTMSIQPAVTSFTVQHNPAASGPGGALTFQAQIAQADGTTGGGLNFNAGGGGTTNGTTGTGGSVNFTAGNGGSSTGSGGSVVLSAGTGNVNGNIAFRSGVTTAITLVPAPTGTTSLSAASTVTALTFTQADIGTASATGAPLTVQAQNATGTTTTGGSVFIKSGTGTTTDGYVGLFAGNTEQARALPNKFSMLTGQRVKVSTATATPYNVASGEYVVVVDIATIGGPSTINLPASPTAGDVYHIKAMGNAASNNVTIAGNGHNIDNSSSVLINTNYANTTVVYNGTTWSIL